MLVRMREKRKSLCFARSERNSDLQIHAAGRIIGNLRVVGCRENARPDWKDVREGSTRARVDIEGHVRIVDGGWSRNQRAGCLELISGAILLTRLDSAVGGLKIRIRLFDNVVAVIVAGQPVVMDQESGPHPDHPAVFERMPEFGLQQKRTGYALAISPARLALCVSRAVSVNRELKK